jgi:hypothetical protein
MKYEKKLHAIATSDAVVLTVSATYHTALAALANLSSVAEAADEAKRVLNDVEFWSNYQKRESSQEYQLHRRTFLTLKHSANLVLPSRLDEAKSAASELQAATKKLRGHEVPGVQRDVLIDFYHTADGLARLMFAEVARLKSRLSESDDEEKAAFDANFSAELTFGWPRVHFLTPWIDVNSIVSHSAALALAASKKIVESNGRALRDVRDFRGHVLDEESYGRRLERAKSKKQRDALIADQRARRLQLNHLRVAVDAEWSLNSDMTSTLVDWANALEAAAFTDKENAEALNNNRLVIVRAIVDCNDARDWINKENNEHRDTYAMVRKFAEEEYTGEAA